MRVGIDARMYGPKQGGLGRYIQQLILHLEKLDLPVEFVIFLRRENWDEYAPANTRFKKALADIKWYGWQEQLLMPGIIKKEKIDLMHFPHWNVPLFYSRPFVVTIHDLLLFHYPTRQSSTLGPLTYWFKNLMFKLVLRHATKQAKHILAVSEFTRKDIHKTLGVPLEKITTIYLAPTILPPYHPTTLPSYTTRPYVLYVGVAFPHKNLEGLLKAWQIFTQKYGNKYNLALAGKENYFYKRLQDSIFKIQSSNIIFTGFVPDADLPNLYKNASLYVMPSFYEGNALPCLEAMACGTPVISSNAACLPEILEDAALYFNPLDAEEMANAIYQCLIDQNLRAELNLMAESLLPKYSWTACAKQTWEIYKKVI